MKNFRHGQTLVENIRQSLLNKGTNFFFVKNLDQHFFAAFLVQDGGLNYLRVLKLT